MDSDTKTLITEACSFKNWLPTSTSHRNTKPQNQQAWKRPSRSPSATDNLVYLLLNHIPKVPDASYTLPEGIVQEDQHDSGRKLSEYAQVFEPCRPRGPVEFLGCLLILSLHSGSCWLQIWVENI